MEPLTARRDHLRMFMLNVINCVMSDISLNFKISAGLWCVRTDILYHVETTTTAIGCLCFLR